MIVTKRVYAPVSPKDGLRVLVDRLWVRVRVVAHVLARAFKATYGVGQLAASPELESEVVRLSVDGADEAVASAQTRRT